MSAGKLKGNDFGWALTQMRAGHRVRRKGWNRADPAFGWVEESVGLSKKGDDLICEDGTPCRWVGNAPLLATDWELAEADRKALEAGRG